MWGRRVGVCVLCASCALSACSLTPFSAPEPEPEDSSPGGAATGGAGGAGGAGAGFGANGGSGATGAAGTETPHPDGYSHRMNIFIEAESALVTGHAVRVELDHAALVAAGTSRTDGGDLRLFESVADSWQERTRVLDPASSWNSAATTLWFALTADLAGDKKDRRFYLYYGNAQAGAPPDDPNDVYAFWDFDTSLEPSWTSESIGAGTISLDTAGGLATITVESGAIGGAADDFGFLYRSQDGDFALDAHQVAAGGSLGPAATLGGAMIRTSNEPTARHVVSGPSNISGQAFARIYRAADGAPTNMLQVGGPPSPPSYSRLIRLGDVISAQGSHDGQTWQSLGAPITFDEPLPDALLVGLAVAADAAAAGWVEVDWLRIRPAVKTEPMVYVKPEEGPF